MKKMIGYLTSLKAILAEVAILLAVIVGVYHGSQVLTPPVDNGLGAVSGGEIQGNELIVGSVKNYYFHRDMIATSTNVCSILTPNATTTLQHASMQVTNGSTGMIYARISRAANAWASTTIIASERLTSGTNVYLSSTSTPQNSWNGTFAPLSYINFAQEGSNAGAGIVGTCDLI